MDVWNVMSFCVMSRACHYDDMIHGTNETGEVGSHIIHILKPSIKSSNAIGAKEGLVLDARLLEEVLQTPIFLVKSIPHSRRLAFFQALKDDLYRVVVDPRFFFLAIYINGIG